MSAPQRFRKLPVEIEARQFLTEDDGQQIAAWIRGYHGTDSVFWFADGPEGPRIVIHTLEGAMIASLGDWIIRGVQGEFYPCKPDIFAESYSFVDDTGRAAGGFISAAPSEIRYAPGTVAIKIEHERGNTVRGPIDLVLRSHLADGWRLASVDVEPPEAPLALTATAAVLVRVIAEGEPVDGALLGTVTVVAPPEHVDEARRVIIEALRIGEPG